MQRNPGPLGLLWQEVCRASWVYAMDCDMLESGFSKKADIRVADFAEGRLVPRYLFFAPADVLESQSRIIFVGRTWNASTLGCYLSIANAVPNGFAPPANG